ncbi:MAG TPA: methionyl-tRNA formyltransferase [Ignavibacteriaceae bacterium]|nr:methionyl-tRNA formyltransferase [Ignavibacteriaceae bacterium]
MKIVFMGTPDFAVPSLKLLLESKYEIAAVVTAPDKERGRGRKVSFTPVKEFALQNNLPVLQPEKLKNQEFANQLKDFNADIFVVVAFRILPASVFTIPPKGSFNLHGSLLPKYRGAAPIQWAIINGEKETGVTTFKLEEKVDTGNIYLQEKLRIDDEDDLGSVHDKMSMLGAEVVLKTVDIINSGNFELQKQDDSLASPAPKITRETGKIDWNKSAEEIHNLIRGLSPFPGAYFSHNEKQIKIYKTKNSDSEKLKPAEIKQTKRELFIGTGKGTLEVLELQQEGKKRMTTEEFLRGFSFKEFCL